LPETPKRLARFALAAGILFVLSLVWNGLVHLVLLRRANEAIQHLRRTDLSGALGWSLLLTGLVCVLFVWGYVRTARTGTLREGVGYGLFIGLLVALMVDVNQYLLYPLPASLVLKWFAGGVLEFTFYGAVVSRICPVRGKESPA
jgi:energy-converting hydrogenase Eha subunit C